jgi:hypothetical protein
LNPHEAFNPRFTCCVLRCLEQPLIVCGVPLHQLQPKPEKAPERSVEDGHLLENSRSRDEAFDYGVVGVLFVLQDVKNHLHEMMQTDARVQQQICRRQQQNSGATIGASNALAHTTAQRRENSLATSLQAAA